MSTLNAQLPPVFIVGCPRSGTTLLGGLLKATPWGTAFETHFIPKYSRKLGGDHDLTNPARFCRTVKSILSERPIQQRGIYFDAAELYERLPKRDYPSVADAIGRSAHCAGERSWADKTPQYVLHLPLLHELFPQSKIVLLVRDGRDVALSLMEKKWGPANVYACAAYWRECHRPRPIVDTLTSQGKLMSVRYEDLLQSPADCAERLLRFLGTDDARGIAGRWSGKVRVSNHGKWKTGMTAAEKQLFSRVAGDTLRRLGYECDEPQLPLGGLRCLAYAAQDRAKHWTHLLRMNTIEAVQIRLFGKEPFAE